MTWRRAMSDRVDGGETDFLEFRSREMDDAMEGHRRHEVDEETKGSAKTPRSETDTLPGNLVQRMKHHRIPPHGNRDSVVAIRQAVGAYEEPLRPRRDPDGQQEQEIDKVAEVGQEIMVAALLICIIPDWHEIGKLDGKPQIEKIRMGSNQVSADEDVQHSGDERYLFSSGDRLGVVPSCAEVINRLPHALSVFCELLLRWRQSTPPFLNHTVLCRPTG